jgi:hypothetical protein
MHFRANLICRTFALGAAFALVTGMLIACSASSGEQPALPPESPPARVLVVGDSLAFQVAQGLGRIQAQHHLRTSNGGVPGCGLVRGGETLENGAWMPSSSFCDSWPRRWSGQMNRTQPEVVVMLTGFWDVFDRRLPGGMVLEFGSDLADEYTKAQLTEALDILTTGGARVLVLATPYFEPDPNGDAKTARDEERVDHMNSIFRDVAGQRDDVEVLDLNDFLTPDGFRASIDDQNVRGDGVHLTPAGQRLIAIWLAPRLVEAVLQHRENQPPNQQ